jgi:hypothetical protein
MLQVGEAPVLTEHQINNIFKYYMNTIRAKLATLKPKAALERKKRANRAAKKKMVLKSRATALPKVERLKLENNYINPVTLNTVPRNVVIYEITNRLTGRKNYYNSTTFWKLTGRTKNNYALLMANPKSPIFKNPMTRTNVYPRNIKRVRAKKVNKKLTPTAAAKKIQSAVRAHLKKKKANKK